MMGKMCTAHKIAWVLLIVGGLNWGLIGLLQFDLVTAIFGAWPMVVRIVYVLVGVSAVMMLAVCKCCMDCSVKSKMMGGEKKM